MSTAIPSVQVVEAFVFSLTTTICSKLVALKFKVLVKPLKPTNCPLNPAKLPLKLTCSADTESIEVLLAAASALPEAA